MDDLQPLEHDKVKVLVLDDDPAVSQLLARLLGGLGADVMLAQSLHDAFEVFEDSPPALALIDVHLGDGNGLDLVPQTRERHPGCVTAVLTADESPAVRAAAAEAGADHFLSKPVRIDDLRRLLLSAAA